MLQMRETSVAKKLFVLLLLSTSAFADVGDLVSTINNPRLFQNGNGIVFFGSKIELNGRQLIVGSPSTRANGGFVGAAHVYDAVDGTLNYELVPPSTLTDGTFGRHVSFIDDRWLVTADELNQPSLYVFNAQGELVSRNRSLDWQFHVGIEPYNGGVLVGDPGTLVADRRVGWYSGLQSPTTRRTRTFQSPSDSRSADSFGGGGMVGFGETVFIADHGLRVFEGQNRTGVVYQIDFASGRLLQTIVNPNPSSINFPPPGIRDSFGESMGEANGHLVVSAPGEDFQNEIEDTGAIYVYDPITGELERTIHHPDGINATPNSEFGQDIDTYGNFILASAPNAVGDSDRAVYLIDVRDGEVLLEFDDPFPDRFGFGVDVAIDDGLVTIADDGELVERDGQFGSGAVFVYESYRFCDANLDGVCDVQDIDYITSHRFLDEPNMKLDIDADYDVDLDDRTFWLNLMETGAGDSNLDGLFDSSDLVNVFVAGLFEDGVNQNAGWAEGDWDGDLDFTTSDLVLAFQAGTYEIDNQPQPVPEPRPYLMMAVAAMLLVLARRRE